MFLGAETVERYGQMLAAAAEQGLSLATDLHADALAAETAEGKARLAAAWNRTTRSLRQTIALAARLDREARRAERDAQGDAERGRRRRADTRKAQVRAAVERLICAEREDEDAEQLVDELDDRLDEEALADDFGADPLEAHIARLCEHLGLPDPSPARSAAGGGGPDRPEAARCDVGRPAAQPPQPLHDGCPEGGASDWRSSA